MANSSFGDPIYVLKGEALIYKGTITPRSTAMSVQLADADLTPEILQQWLLQSLTPLVGMEAVTELKALLDMRPEVFKPFLDKAFAFRSNLK
jgi:mevalonate kinase